MHGVGERNIFNAFKVTEVLMRHKYAEISRIKTKRVVGFSGKWQAKIVIHLKKTAEFDTVFANFEQEVAARRAAQKPLASDCEDKDPSAESKEDHKETPKETPKEADSSEEEQAETKEKQPERLDQ